MRAWRWRAAHARTRLSRELRGLRYRPAPAKSELDSELLAVEERLVWIFGSPRSGSSWLLTLLREHDEVVPLDETYLPSHLVPLGIAAASGEYLAHGERADDPNYFFARPYLSALRPELRGVILRQLVRQAQRFGYGSRTRWVLIKEPNGSHAADTMLSLVPRARLIFLLRDGRDVVDSLADAMLGEGTWWERGKARRMAAANRMAFLRQHARLWVRRTAAVQRAFSSLPEERRLLVRYEDLRRDTFPTVRSIYDWLGLEASDRRLRATVKREAFEAIPSDRRGSGRVYRFATPGRWRESFSPREQRVLHRIMGAKLRELGYEA